MSSTVLLAADRTLQSTCRSAAFSSAEKIINDSDFPSLGGSPFTPTTSYGNNSPVPSSGLFSKDAFSALQRAPYANLMRSSADGLTSSNSNSEFHILNEDFPALPGAQPSGPANSQQQLKGVDATAMGATDAGNAAQAARYADAQAQQGSGEGKPGIQTHPDGLVTNIPPGMLNDQYGMAGLLTFLRTLDSDPSIVALALGHDLTNLGLNLNSSDRNLYQTFGGPWAESPCRIQDLDAKVPDEYLTNASIRDKLPNIKLNKLSDDVLFYLFYNCPGEVYQLAAASELYQRDWRYHKVEQVWLTRSAFGGVKEQTATYEKGSYNVFDPVQWRKIPKEMTLEYKLLEGRPSPVVGGGMPASSAHLNSGLGNMAPTPGTPAGMTNGFGIPGGAAPTPTSVMPPSAIGAAQQQQPPVGSSSNASLASALGTTGSTHSSIFSADPLSTPQMSGVFSNNLLSGTSGGSSAANSLSTALGGAFPSAMSQLTSHGLSSLATGSSSAIASSGSGATSSAIGTSSATTTSSSSS